MTDLETSSAGQPEGGLPLSFEAWAELSAQLSNVDQEQRFNVLDERDVTVEDWQHCEEHYALALADDIGQGRMERARFYADKCVAETERRQKAREAPPVVVPSAEAADTKSDPAPMREPVRAPETSVPSFLQPREVSAVAIGAMPSIQRSPEQLAGTAMAFELPTALRPKVAAALPFQAGASPTLATSPAEPRRPPAPAPTAGETVGVGVDLLAQMRGTLPFAKTAAAAPSVAYPRLPLNSYASFCAELSVSPEKTAAIFAKYNVSGEPAHAALVQEWDARFEAHADTKAEWQELFHQLRGWLLQQPR